MDSYNIKFILQVYKKDGFYWYYGNVLGCRLIQMFEYAQIPTKQ